MYPLKLSSGLLHVLSYAVILSITILLKALAQLPRLIPRKILFGNPDTETEFLKSRSPLFNVDQIKIPLLIAHGAKDQVDRKEESYLIVEALRASGKPMEYLLFPDEGHGLVRPENRLKFYKIAETFLAKYLGGRKEK